MYVNLGYLGFPRLNFSGLFQADVSTVNNDPKHFNNATFTPNDQERGQGSTNGWWNPKGTGNWALRKCKVSSVYYKDGSFCDDKLVDPIIDTRIGGAADQPEGKLVDLDPQQQMVSTIWGFKIQLGDPLKENSFNGDYNAAAFSDIWVRFPKGKPDSYFSAMYQSIISGINWSSIINSRFLNELKDKNGSLPKELSIKFTVDGFNMDYTSADFTWGRIVGAIGPYDEGEPKHFVAGRCLRPQTQNSPLSYSYATLCPLTKTLFVDLGNSMPTTSSGGPQADVNKIQIGVIQNDKPVITIGQPINYLSNGWYDVKSGIVNMKLTDDEFTLASSNPLAIVSGSKVYLSENSAGAFLRADDFVFRINPGETKTVKVYATKFGKMCPDQKINLTLDSPFGPTPPQVGIPESALKFPDSVITNESGIAEFEITGDDPGNPRGYIDGQVYGISYSFDETIDNYRPNSSNFLSILLWSAYEYDGKPTWEENVKPILQQYANLYPVMKGIVDLADYDSVKNNRDIMKLVFNLPVSDPNYMPVTRDLSLAKREMIKTWLEDPSLP